MSNPNENPSSLKATLSQAAGAIQSGLGSLTGSAQQKASGEAKKAEAATMKADLAASRQADHQEVVQDRIQDAHEQHGRAGRAQVEGEEERRRELAREAQKEQRKEMERDEYSREGLAQQGRQGGLHQGVARDSANVQREAGMATAGVAGGAVGTSAMHQQQQAYRGSQAMNTSGRDFQESNRMGEFQQPGLSQQSNVSRQQQPGMSQQSGMSQTHHHTHPHQSGIPQGGDAYTDAYNEGTGTGRPNFDTTGLSRSDVDTSIPRQTRSQAAASRQQENYTTGQGAYPSGSGFNNASGSNAPRSMEQRDREGKWEQAKGVAKEKIGDVTGREDLKSRGERQAVEGFGMQQGKEFGRE